MAELPDKSHQTDIGASRYDYGPMRGSGGENLTPEKELRRISGFRWRLPGRPADDD